MSIWGDPVLIGNNGAIPPYTPPVPPYTPPTTYSFKKQGAWYEIPDNFKAILGSSYPYFRLSMALMLDSVVYDNWFEGRFFLAKITDVDMGDNYPHIVVFSKDHFVTDPPTYRYRFYIKWYSTTTYDERNISSCTFDSMLETGDRSYRILPTLNYSWRDPAQGVYVDTPIVGWPINAVALEGPLAAVEDFIKNYDGGWS